MGVVMAYNSLYTFYSHLVELIFKHTLKVMYLYGGNRGVAVCCSYKHIKFK